MLKQMPPHSNLFESTADGNTKFSTNLNTTTNGYQPYYHPTNISTSSSNLNSLAVVSLNNTNNSFNTTNSINSVTNSYFVDQLTTSFNTQNSNNLIFLNRQNQEQQLDSHITFQEMEDEITKLNDEQLINEILDHNDINSFIQNDTKQYTIAYNDNNNNNDNNTSSNAIQLNMPTSSSNVNSSLLTNIKQEQSSYGYAGEEDEASSSTYSYGDNESYSSSNRLSPFSNHSNSFNSIGKYEFDFKPTTSSSANSEDRKKSHEKKYGPITVRPRKNPAPTLASGRKSKYIQLTAEEEYKRELRRRRNRQAAEKCKLKRNEIEERLEQNLASLLNEEKQLKSDNEELAAEKAKLESFLNKHIESCSQTPSPISDFNLNNSFNASHHQIKLNTNTEYSAGYNNYPITQPLVNNYSIQQAHQQQQPHAYQSYQHSQLINYQNNPSVHNNSSNTNTQYQVYNTTQQNWNGI